MYVIAAATIASIRSLLLFVGDPSAWREGGVE